MDPQQPQQQSSTSFLPPPPQQLPTTTTTTTNNHYRQRARAFGKLFRGRGGGGNNGNGTIRSGLRKALGSSAHHRRRHATLPPTTTTTTTPTTTTAHTTKSNMVFLPKPPVFTTAPVLRTSQIESMDAAEKDMATTGMKATKNQQQQQQQQQQLPQCPTSPLCLMRRVNSRNSAAGGKTCRKDADEDDSSLLLSSTTPTAAVQVQPRRRVQSLPPPFTVGEPMQKDNHRHDRQDPWRKAAPRKIRSVVAATATPAFESKEDDDNDDVLFWKLYDKPVEFQDEVFQQIYTLSHDYQRQVMVITSTELAATEEEEAPPESLWQEQPESKKPQQPVLTCAAKQTQSNGKGAGIENKCLLIENPDRTNPDSKTMNEHQLDEDAKVCSDKALIDAPILQVSSSAAATTGSFECFRALLQQAEPDSHAVENQSMTDLSSLSKASSSSSSSSNRSSASSSFEHYLRGGRVGGNQPAKQSKQPYNDKDDGESLSTDDSSDSTTDYPNILIMMSTATSRGTATSDNEDEQVAKTEGKDELTTLENRRYPRHGARRPHGKYDMAFNKRYQEKYGDAAFTTDDEEGDDDDDTEAGHGSALNFTEFYVEEVVRDPDEDSGYVSDDDNVPYFVDPIKMGRQPQVHDDMEAETDEETDDATMTDDDAESNKVQANHRNNSAAVSSEKVAELDDQAFRDIDQQNESLEIVVGDCMFWAWYA